MSKWFTRTAFLATGLTFIVVVLGAYVRLTDAGLGCPDWPGCYGQLIAPEASHEAALDAFPGARIETHKAWKEMIHRYVAGILGLVVLLLAIMAWRNRSNPQQQLLLPTFLVFLVAFQAALGMWTVTMLVMPVIVTLHLLTGMLTLSLLWWISLRSRTATSCSYAPELPTFNLKPWAFLGILVVFTQIALGGWTSTNYAALHCPDFPTCQQQWWPSLDFAGAFNLIGETGVNYEGGRLTNDQGVTVHLMHRIGAVITLLYIGLLAYLAIFRSAGHYQNVGKFIAVILSVQFLLGVSNVIFILPLSIAVAHNGGAALLLLSVIYLNYKIRQGKISIHTRGD